MSAHERTSFVKALEGATFREPKWWGGLTSEAIAQISNPDDLPQDFYGRLIMAVTEDGFSVGEALQVQKSLAEVIAE